jgi:hypothetical protein
MIRILGALFLISLLPACTSGSEGEITGKWYMLKVIQSGQDVTSEHNPFNERFISIRVDNSFESDGRPYGKNTGKYIFNNEESTLFLDSDSGPDDDSQWKVTFKGDTMHWQGFGSKWAEAFELLHIKDNM